MKSSISSLAMFWNSGISCFTSFGENAGLASRRSREWSAPSLLSSMRIHQSAKLPVALLCAGQA
ncbi:hypothetical protein D9M71_314040 [compost metagenome]